MPIRRIGVFDSGFGGLHTLRALRDSLPEYNYLYLADSARAPYGPRPAEEIRAFSAEALEYLFHNGCELVIFACNTASSDALRFLQQNYLPRAFPKCRVLGVLIPLSELAAQSTLTKRIGVLATEGTVRSDAFVRELGKLDAQIQVFQEAAPGLVPLIESGGHASPEMRSLLELHLRPLIDASIDTLILGCTHYGFAIEAIRAIVGPDVSIVSDADAVPSSLHSYLARHTDLNAMLSRDGTLECYTTGDPLRFDEIGSGFFGSPLQASRVGIGLNPV